MKTSVIEVHAMLSVLSVDEVERRIAEVPGVESVTVNFAAKNATVRYDETHVDVADIKSGVRLRGHESAAPMAPPAVPVATAVAADAPKPVAEPAPEATSAPAPKPDAAAMPAGMKMPDSAPTGPDTAAAPKAADPSTPDAPVEKPSLWQRLRSRVSPAASAPEDQKPAASAQEGDHKGHAAHGGTSSPMSADMAKEMGHGGNMDLPAMVRDMRNRFWICLVFAVPIFIYSPMGGLFAAPEPPFGVPLNVWLFGLASAAILYPSWPFFVAAWYALKSGTLNMATLVVLSVGTGYLFSVGATFFFESDQFFEAVA
ncbi:MAG: heavy metal translocating P-type ATPase, partial [Ramlibacter sp.]